MEVHAGGVTFAVAAHGAGLPVFVLHGAGVDHRETEACFEPALAAVGGLRRLYVDLPGTGRTTAPDRLRSADDVLAALQGLLDASSGGSGYLLVGHSFGAYYAQELAARSPGDVRGLAMVCPWLPGSAGVPERRVVGGTGDLGDEDFRDYFVVQTPEMLDRYQRFVAPAAALVDHAALDRIGARWELTAAGPPYAGPTLVVAGRLDGTAGYAAAVGLLSRHPRATLAVLDDAGHALPHEQPEILAALIADWVRRVRRLQAKN